MTVVGGLRARLIYDSLHAVIATALDDLGWYDTGRQHRPINFLERPVPANEEIPLNSLVLADEDQSETDDELGSQLAEHRWTYYVDFYAEDDVIGKHLIYDVKALLGGRLPSIGRGDPSVVVYDYRLATPTALFVVQIEGVVVDRAHDFPHAWQKHWYACRFTVVDHHGTEDDDS